jgi:ribonucleoside-triphosphate reductase
MDYKNYEDFRPYVDFIQNYRLASNASTGSAVDANANVEYKNVTTMTGELTKQQLIGVNRLIMFDTLKKMFDEDIAKEYLRQLDNHEIYKHDETQPNLPYCVSITMYPYLFNGMAEIGGISDSPKNLQSFCGSFINLVFAIAAQFAGAVSTPEFLTYMDYFIRKEYGDEYYKHPTKVVDGSNRHRTMEEVIIQYWQQIVYSLNQPAAARNYQSVFWNIAYFDKAYFNGIFEDFVFPDGTRPNFDSVMWLQKRFMQWFNQERLRKILTFPVETANSLGGVDENGNVWFDDENFADFLADMWSQGHSFFWYNSDSVDSLASCCRLRNALQDNTFSYTLGAGGVSTGSKCVITINFNRLIQNTYKNKEEYINDENHLKLDKAIRNQVNKIHKYLAAYNENLNENLKAGLMPVYDAGYISMDKQYLTIGINGLVEGAEFLGIPISPNGEYEEYCTTCLKPIYEENKKAKTKDIMYNTEYVPAENLGVKNAKWDKKDGLFSPRDCYNSYFFLPEDNTLSVIDKLILHGSKTTKWLDGGVACHINLEEHLTKEQYKKLMADAIKAGCQYLTFNVPNTVCNDCGYISKHKFDKCPRCGSENVDWATRIIGYLKLISRFSEKRQEEAAKRYYIDGTNY